MTQKDCLKAKIDFWKILLNTLVGVMFAISVYNLQIHYSFLGGIISLVALGVTAILLYSLRYKKFLKKLELEETETLNVKLDINFNDDIILKKDEKFKIIFEKDDKGNIVIRKG